MAHLRRSKSKTDIKRKTLTAVKKADKLELERIQFYNNKIKARRSDNILNMIAFVAVSLFTVLTFNYLDDSNYTALKDEIKKNDILTLRLEAYKYAKVNN